MERTTTTLTWPISRCKEDKAMCARTTSGLLGDHSTGVAILLPQATVVTLRNRHRLALYQSSCFWKMRRAAVYSCAARSSLRLRRAGKTRNTPGGGRARGVGRPSASSLSLSPLPAPMPYRRCTLLRCLEPRAGCCRCADMDAVCAIMSGTTEVVTEMPVYRPKAAVVTPSAGVGCPSRW